MMKTREMTMFDISAEGIALDDRNFENSALAFTSESAAHRRFQNHALYPSTMWKSVVSTFVEAKAWTGKHQGWSHLLIAISKVRKANVVKKLEACDRVQRAKGFEWILLAAPSLMPNARVIYGIMIETRLGWSVPALFVYLTPKKTHNFWLRAQPPYQTFNVLESSTMSSEPPFVSRFPSNLSWPLDWACSSCCQTVWQHAKASLPRRIANEWPIILCHREIAISGLW